jgi:hypothetical protein
MENSVIAGYFAIMEIKLLLLFGVLAITSHVYSAEIYRWVDKDGKVHFTDSPPPDVKSEQMTVEVDEVGEPDEGELRRRQLLEQANLDAAERLEQRRAAAEAKRVGKEAREAIEQDCLDARIRLEILEEPQPVYRDANGALRLRWQFDTYKGPRSYIDDADRPAEVERARQEVAEICDNPDDRAEQARARITWINSERCAAARADLEAVEKPQSKATSDTIEDRRRAVARYCTKSS